METPKKPQENQEQKEVVEDQPEKKQKCKIFYSAL